MLVTPTTTVGQGATRVSIYQTLPPGIYALTVDLLGIPSTYCYTTIQVSASGYPNRDSRFIDYKCNLRVSIKEW